MGPPEATRSFTWSAVDVRQPQELQYNEKRQPAPAIESRPKSGALQLPTNPVHTIHISPSKLLNRQRGLTTLIFAAVLLSSLLILNLARGDPLLNNLPDTSIWSLSASRHAETDQSSTKADPFCPRDTGCRFLAPGYTAEQESKATGHLYQLGLLATALNRTLVLPNAHGSRFGLCLNQTFDYYYAPESLTRLGFTTVHQRDLRRWATSRSQLPTAQSVTLARPSNRSFPTTVSMNLLNSTESPHTTAVRGTPDECTEPPQEWLDFNSFSSVVFSEPEQHSWHQSEETRVQVGKDVIAALKDLDICADSARQPQVSIDPDVLVVDYDLVWEVLSVEAIKELNRAGLTHVADSKLDSLQDFSPFDYASHWTRLAEQIATSLSPFIAVHWRQETMPADRIEPCAAALLDNLRNISAEWSALKTVYLATDYPFDNLQSGSHQFISYSGSWKADAMTEHHHSAMRSVLDAFNAQHVGHLELATYRSLQRSGQANLESLDAVDSALIGMIDKQVAIMAQVFLAGQPWVCGKESSYTRMIVAERKERLMEQEQAEVGQTAELWQDVEYWSDAA